MNRILVADQDETICLLYEDGLSEMGYDVITVTRPKDFLTAVVSNEPDLLLLCSRMVLEEGIWRVLVTIRNSDRSCPVILLCANRLPVAEALLTLSEGAILKGPDLRELKLKIKHILAKKSGENLCSWPSVENGWLRTKDIDVSADTENLIFKEERNRLDYGFHAGSIRGSVT